MSWWVWPAFAALGAVGAVARFVVEIEVMRLAGRRFPIGTMVVNVSGALLLGLVVGAGLNGDARTLVTGGLLGSYTTFSAWMLQTTEETRRGAWALAYANVAVSAALGLAAVALGRALTG